MGKKAVKITYPHIIIEKYIEGEEAFKSIKLIPLKEQWLQAKGIDEKVKIIGKVLGLED